VFASTRSADHEIDTTVPLADVLAEVLRGGSPCSAGGPCVASGSSRPWGGELAASRTRLEESASEFHFLFREDSVARFVIDEAGALVRWNGALERFLGRSAAEIEGRTLAEVGLDAHVDEAVPLGRAEASTQQVDIRRCDESGQAVVGLMGP
jgi:PAS domain-containing protein